MCHHTRRYDVGYEQFRSHRSFRHWSMSWLPFAVIMFFVFGPHTWAFHAWMWFLLPVTVVIASSFFVKAAHQGGMLYNGTRTQERLSTQLYAQGSYYHPGQETYREGGQQFRYPQQQDQVQQSSYEEPRAYYPPATPPME